MKRKWDVSSEQIRSKCASEIITRIEEQDGAPFGVIAAEDIIQIVLQNIGPDIYNLAIRDAKKVVGDKLADVEVELDLLNDQSQPTTK